jgi:hypothetical protein
MTPGAGWWRWWAAPEVRRAPDGGRPEASQEEGLDAERAATMLSRPEAYRTDNAGRLAAAAHRLQRRIGNRGVALLAGRAGRPVPPGMRDALRPAPADDLADVRLHTGPEGDEIVRPTGARAVTVGRDIAFARNAYAPDTPGGRLLLTDELSHAVQVGGDPGRDPAALEAEAHSAAPPSRGRAAPGTVLAQQPATWRERVAQARAETDPARRRAALVALAQEALTGYTVHVVADRPATGPVKAAQYAAAPAINFDVHLEEKEFHAGAGRSGRLGSRAGYYFSDAGRAYAIIGPSALEPATPALTRMHADHELFHASHHVGSRATWDDTELEAWVDAFVRYFHLVHTARKSWMPMIDYYEGATAAARTAALRKLTEYFAAQPADVQRAMLRWLARRAGDAADKKLVQDLTARIARAPAPGRAAPPPAPTPP